MRIIEIWPDSLSANELADGRIRCNALALKKRFWEDLSVVGPDLVRRKAVAVEDPQKARSDFASIIFFNRMMSVRLVLDDGYPMSLDELKRLVISDMHDESIWAAAGDPAIYREHTANAQSFDDVWEIMNGEYWKRVKLDPSGFALEQ